ncbi:metallophosphoesterase [Flavobacterium sp. ASW18X]|uniref:metallophosphoesterase n=1 Tax=Flavobacterium sp. ASW18X TaxID=2572595 RepID=UPI0010AE7888|nr:metallophosphoesterase [Flavobacterium sp. ASW18X]TKD65258.1 serine/threonine protein phosphatase [Flavobacterium sp. ASW18X]
MRTLVIGDVHSGLRAVEQVLDRAAVTADDHIVFLGDYVDSWSDAFETIAYLIQLNTTHNCTFIRGNHDELCLDWLVEGKDNPTWLLHGGAATKASYEKRERAAWESHIHFLQEELVNNWVDNNNNLYLHAGFTNLKGIEHEYFEKTFYWDRTLWELAQALNPELSVEDARFPKRLTHYNEIFIGHTPISKTGLAVPKNGANVWNVDTGAAFMGALTIMDVATKEYWQSDPVHTLYPSEKGRN